MKKKSTFGLAIVFVLLAVFFIYLGFKKSGDKEKKKDKAIRKVAAYVVSRTTLIDEITVSGSIIANEEIDLRNEIGGRIVQLNLPEGKAVKRGTLLVKFFDDDLRATLKKLESELVVKRRIYNRQSGLIKINGVSQNEYDQTGLDVNTLEADIAAEKAAIRKTEIRAPFDGVVGLKNVSVGAVIGTGTSIASFRSNGFVKLDFFVAEKYSSKLKPGMDISFTLGDPDKKYRAKIIATEHGIDAGTRNMKVRAIVNSHSPELMSGAFVSVTIRLSENPNAIMIPTSSIIPSEDRKTVFVSRRGKASIVKIKTGIRQTQNIEITEGICVGDTVIVNGIQFLKDKSPLSFSSVTKSL